MRAWVFACFVLAACVPQIAPEVASGASCIPDGYDRPKLEALKAAQFEIADDAMRQGFARAITACLAAPDPELRDGIAFEALSHMGRAKQLTPDTMKAIAAQLEPWLDATDSDGFRAPFAALALSELARADRIEAYLSDDELSGLMVRGVRFLEGWRDYRGFDERDGWRHGVAHGSDLLMQLALNPRVGRAGLDAIRRAVAAQIAPVGVSYIDGESERLARPILMAARRGVFAEAEWTAWLAGVAGPGDVGSWDAAFKSRAGLARVHDVKAFVYALWTNVTADDDPADDVLKPGLLAVLKQLP